MKKIHKVLKAVLSIVTNLSDDDKTAFFHLYKKEGCVMYYDHKKVEWLKERYPEGTRICLDRMNDDPFPVESGTFGRVDHVDDIGTVHCVFDNGRTLGVIPGVDDFHVIREESEQTEEEEMNMSM